MRTYLYICYGNINENIGDFTSVYFLRNTEGMVPLPNSIEEAKVDLPKCFEFGVLNGHSLNMLEQIITWVRLSFLYFSGPFTIHLGGRNLPYLFAYNKAIFRFLLGE